MKLENLTQIFNNNVFMIPDYQRGYSWGKSQLEDLWRDIEILEDEQDHYTGMLSVKLDKQINYVIDGQQRIATLIIFIKIIIDKFKGDEWLNGKEVSDYIKTFLYKKTGDQGKVTKMIFGYDKDNPSHIYFKTKILGLENTDDSTPEYTLYTKNLNQAKSFFEDKISDLKKEEIEKLLQKITENLKFNFYEIENELNEFVAFETMNNRGKPLSTLELLKNRLIYLSTLLPNNDNAEKEQLRCDINNAWKTIYEYLGKNPEKSLDDDLFLQNHCFIYFKFDKNINKQYKDFLLKTHFTTNAVIPIKQHKELNKRTITYKDIKDYVADIQISVKHYYFVHNVKDSQCPYTDEEKKIISKINRIGFQSFKPLIVSLCCYDGYKERRYMLFNYIERCIFIMFHINFDRFVKKSTIFYHLANDVCKNTSSEDTIITIFAEIYTEYKPYDLSQKFISKISEYEKGFYEWKGLRYFLYEYEIYLQEQYRGELKKVEWEHVNTETIEHIYPQNPDDESWTDVFEDEDLLHDLGNLLLLSQSANSSLNNKPFDDKRKRFSTNSYSAIKISKSKNWTPDKIVERREEMLDFLDERWDLEIKDDVLKKLNEENV